MAKASNQSSGAGLVFFLGLALVATGIGFATAPHYSWQVTKIARQAAGFGLQNGVLVVGGLVLFGLAIVARRVGAASGPVEQEDNGLAEEVRVLSEQLSAKVAQVRTAQLQIAESLAAISAEQQAHFHKQASERGNPTDHGQDAIFRMAASLDKLNAHLDERIHSIDLQLRSGMETLASEIRRVSAERRVEPAIAPRAPFASPELGLAHSNPHAQHAPEGAIDFYETMQKLDAIASAGEPNPAPHHQPPAPFGTSAGSTLDTLLPEDYRKQY